VAVLHPAEALNAQPANALLKTLEEPPAGTRLLLTAADPSLLLPTVRSRCQSLALPRRRMRGLRLAGRPGREAHPQVLLAACSGRPLDALALSQAGCHAEVWSGLPQAVARGQAAAFAGWPMPRVLDALHKLCHDAMARASGRTDPLLCGRTRSGFGADGSGSGLAAGAGPPRPPRRTSLERRAAA
jgi:DNA polymerase-3 subunit delta'